MTRRALILVVFISMFLIIPAQHLLAMSLEEAMLRLQIEVLQAQMVEFLAQNDMEKAKDVLGKMTELDEKIRSFSKDEVEVYIEISKQPKPEKAQTATTEQIQPDKPVVKTNPDDVMVVRVDGQTEYWDGIPRFTTPSCNACVSWGPVDTTIVTDENSGPGICDIHNVRIVWTHTNIISQTTQWTTSTHPGFGSRLSPGKY